jgi:drug/metabolite transporter (DMT)-like permease
MYSIIGGIAGALGNGFIVKALEKGDLSVLGPINAYKSIIGMLFAFLLIGEIPNQWGLIGMGLIITGSYFVLDTANERFSWRIFKKPEIQFRLWALVLTGIQAVTDKNVIQHSKLKIAFAGWSIFGAFFSFLFILFTPVQLQSEFTKMNRKIASQFLLLVCTVGLMLASTNYTLLNMPVGYALALFQLSIILSVVLGHRIFNEGHVLRKLFGACIMVGGSVLIILLK